MIIMYSAMAILMIAIYLWLRLTDVKRSVSQNVMILSLAWSSIGYVFLCMSENVREAIVAQKLVYISGCFMPFLYMLIVCEICHFKIHRRMVIPLCIVQLFLYGMVCTIGYTDWYYKTVDIVTINGFTHLVKTYGPMHVLYPLQMVAYFAAAIILSIVAIVRKKPVNRKELALTLVFTGISLGLYVLQRVAHLKYDLTSFSNVTLVIGSLIPIYHSNQYTVNENRMIIGEQLSQLGFITFNHRMQYMGANDFAIDIFPELKSYKIGDEVKNCSSELQKIIDTISTYEKRLRKSREYLEKSDIQVFYINDKTYETVIHPLRNFIKRCVGYTIEMRDQTEHYEALALTNGYNAMLRSEVKAKTNRIRSIQDQTILGIATMVESRDLSTGGHIRRTSDVVRIFSKKLLEADMGFTEEFLEMVIRSAPMHDLGKIGVDDAILRKKGAFDNDEFEQMKKHAAIGGDMVNDILVGVEEPEFVNIAENVARYHHEKVNGKGYPEGLKGDEIPIEARIMAFADVFDALVSERCYKKALSYDEAFAIIENDAGSHFDPKLAKVFLDCENELVRYYDIA